MVAAVCFSGLMRDNDLMESIITLCVSCISTIFLGMTLYTYFMRNTKVSPFI